jgi:hypothetical protein
MRLRKLLLLLLRKWSRKRNPIQTQVRAHHASGWRRTSFTQAVWMGMTMGMTMKRHPRDALRCAEHVEAPDAGRYALLLGVGPW